MFPKSSNGIGIICQIITKPEYDLKLVLKNEYDEIIDNNWKFLNNTYKSNIKKQYHRRAIPIFVFLTEICSHIKMPSPVYNIEKDFLEEWVDDKLANCFSNSITRLLYSKIYNPKSFEHCTLLLDVYASESLPYIDIDDNSANDKDLYEIQYIIKHRKINNNEIEYEVKWRNYKKQYNSWVKESDFQSDDIIKKYWKTINSKNYFVI
ncbi:hypothetical protein BDB01DRAFT_833700 [Pilobolus umbonatus]|nr:hypothetical protein BDB01DRAFT_833700 [Pilobolus umbonatus]